MKTDVLKWLRKYPLMVSVFVSGAAAVAMALGHKEIAEFLLDVASGYGEAGFGAEHLALLIFGVYQAVMPVVKFFRDRAKAKQLKAAGIVDRRG